MFAKLFETPHGQFLAFKQYDHDDDQPVIVNIGAPVRGVVPKVKGGYDSEEDRDAAFDKLDQAMADNMAKALAAAAGAAS